MTLCLTLPLLHVGAALAAAGAIGSAVAAILTGSAVLLVIAALCALIGALSEAIAFERAMNLRFDALHRSLPASRRSMAPLDDGGRL